MRELGSRGERGGTERWILMEREKNQYEEQHSVKRKKSHKLYAFIVLLLGLIIIALTLLVFFHIQKIEITGNEYCTDRQIADTLQSDKYSVNSIYVCVKYALGYGEQLPCIEKMKVRMGWPWVLKVEVKEKQIVGYLFTSDQQYAYFDKEGLIVKKGQKYIEGIPCVEGTGVEDIELYKRIDNGNSGIFEEILEASQEFRKYERIVDKIVCKNNRIYIYIGKICISLGDNVTPEKIAQIDPILEELEGREGTLHLENYGEGRETITFDIGEFPEEN